MYQTSVGPSPALQGHVNAQSGTTSGIVSAQMTAQLGSSTIGTSMYLLFLFVEYFMKCLDYKCNLFLHSNCQVIFWYREVDEGNGCTPAYGSTAVLSSGISHQSVGGVSTVIPSASSQGFADNLR